MRDMVSRFRWTSWLAASALAFQVLALVLTTPMQVGRGLAQPVAVEHCDVDGGAAGHHGDAGKIADACQICIGMQAAGHAVTPVAPALPLPIRASSETVAAVAIEAPRFAPPRPQNPRAPPLSA